MATLSAEDVLARFEATEAELLRLRRAEQEQRTACDGFRQEIADLRAQLASRPPGTYGRDFQLVDPKTMVPEKFGEANGPTWQVWSHKTKAYISMLDASLDKHFTAAEVHDEALTAHDLERAGIAQTHDAQIQRLLILRTDSTAHHIVKGAQAEKCNSLEVWRRLATRYDPKGLGSDLLELQELTSPEKMRAKSLEGISSAIQAWEEMERRHLDRNGFALHEKLRISVLFKLIPIELTKELIRQPTKWTSYAQLKDHLNQVQYCRTNGPAPMMMNLEADQGDQEVIMEDGEVYRLEKKNGKQYAVKRPAAAASTRRPASFNSDRPQRECYRCGRVGHVQSHCTWATHKNGGPPKERPAPRTQANHVEKDEGEHGAVQVPERVIGHLEINTFALEPEPVALTNRFQAFLDQAVQEAEWYQQDLLNDDLEEGCEDPWETWGQDPWSCGVAQCDLRTPEKICGAPSIAVAPVSPMPMEPPKGVSSPLYPHWADLVARCPWMPATPPQSFTPLSWNVKSSETMTHSEVDQAAPAEFGIPSSWEVVETEDIDYENVETTGTFGKMYNDEIWEIIDDDLEAVEAVVGCQNTPVGKVSRATQTGLADEGEIYFDVEDGFDLCVVDLDIGACDTTGLREVDVTVDSGAGEPVCNPKSFPGVVVEPSAGSKAGQVYLGPGKERIPNQGQFKADVILEDGGDGAMGFQAADVRKPLLAVSGVNDRGNLVLFDNDGSFIIPGTCPEVSAIRALVQAAVGKIKLHRKNGVFHMRCWQKPQGFSRQGM